MISLPRFFIVAWSIFLSLVFFLPTLTHGLGGDSIFFTFGDGFKLWAPQLVNLYQLVHVDHVWMGVDWFTDNGATSFFLRPNILVYYPPVLLGCFLFKLNHLSAASVFLSWMLVIQAILAGISTQAVCLKYLKLTKEVSLFVAIAFVFSYQNSANAYLYPFTIIGFLFPVLLWCALEAASSTKITPVLLAIFVGLCMLLGGYLPLALFSFLVAFLLVALHQFYGADNAQRFWRTGLRLSLPFLVSGLIVFPFYLAILLNPETLNPGISNLESAAYNLSFHIQDLFWIFSSPLVFSFGYEQNISLGVIGFVLLLLMIFTSRPQPENTWHARVVWCGFILYFGVLLITFGASLHLSDLFYYFAPGLGGMHIYARYLIPCRLPLCFALGLGLSTFIGNAKMQRPLKIAIFALLLAMVSLMFAHVDSTIFANRPELIIELLLAAIFFIILLKAPKPSILLPLILFVALLNREYMEVNWFHRERTILRDPLSLRALQTQFQSSPKLLVKLANLAGVLPFSYFPHNYPWLYNAQTTQKMSNYYGYDLDSGYPQDYRVHFPFYGIYDWSWMITTGLDYVVFDQATRQQYAKELSTYTDLVHAQAIGADLWLAKVFPEASVPGLGSLVYDNGYIRLFSEGPSTPPIQVSHFHVRSGKEIRFKLASAGTLHLLYPFYPSPYLRLSINGHRAQFGRFQNFYEVDLPPGTYAISIVYQNDLLKLFLTLFMSFFLISLGVLSWKCYQGLTRKLKLK